ncbi:uncharacterized protein EI90DRAFT_3012457 [Cantharellus anzutake]|uniref:uncharacterized protein n=1 Tax=Cantharellus anzutake TaxID=1750568 RepID=UPI0019032D7D|nr:uncharacterized protein EI90DRAFT_3012457 [Cantharellus anzutake]KAF8340665.1 hypothetical protein EI90DRAFT_3012457 [Cantharellus anzutake]
MVETFPIGAPSSREESEAVPFPGIRTSQARRTRTQPQIWELRENQNLCNGAPLFRNLTVCWGVAMEAVPGEGECYELLLHESLTMVNGVECVSNDGPQEGSGFQVRVQGTTPTRCGSPLWRRTATVKFIQLGLLVLHLTWCRCPFFAVRSFNALQDGLLLDTERIYTEATQVFLDRHAQARPLHGSSRMPIDNFMKENTVILTELFATTKVLRGWR